MSICPGQHPQGNPDRIWHEPMVVKIIRFKGESHVKRAIAKIGAAEPGDLVPQKCRATIQSEISQKTPD